ncbi:MAG: tetratricopeptide repeat protein [Prevotellaceae bacterium]|nr:tetratricopeptide repeat protein [Candidatus Minthosoma caballi]
MAKKQQPQPKTDEPIALDVQLSKGEAFIEKNWKVISAILGAVIIIVLGTYFYKNYMAGREAEAQKAIASAQTAFAQQQWEQALNGEGNSKGFIKIIDEFGGTKTANLAKLYAGLACANTGKTDEAIKYLEDYSAQGDQMVSPSALEALGNCYVQKGENEKGAETLMKAASKANNDAVSPVFLLQAGQIYESIGNNDKAIEIYNQIKKQYFRSPVSQDIDKYIERATK